MDRSNIGQGQSVAEEQIVGGERGGSWTYRSLVFGEPPDECQELTPISSIKDLGQSRAAAA